jgi:hypothetical protein
MAIRHFVDDPTFELVGALVISEAKHGKYAGKLPGVGVRSMKLEFERSHSSPRRPRATRD